MFKHRCTLPLLAAITLAAGMALPAIGQAQNLLIHRVHEEKAMGLPAHGMTMAQVERRYGAPQRKLQPRGGGSRLHPVIYRWEYPQFIVYFEHTHVIHSVLNTPAGNNLHPASMN